MADKHMALIIRLWTGMEQNVPGQEPILRASLQQAGSDHIHYFSNLDECLVFLQQLADGGRMVIPVGPDPSQHRLLCYTRKGRRIWKRDLGPFCFVPLVGVEGRDQSGS